MGRITKILAKPISYSNKKRSRKDVEYIVIHYTGNTADTAMGNGTYFAQSNTRQAGAHFFVGPSGKIVKSVNMNRTAWSVGGFYSQEHGAGQYYQMCTNSNSVSIELCSATQGYTDEQAEAVKWLIKYIRKYCPNAKKVIRHWDVNGKSCPAVMIGKKSKMWNRFLADIGEE